MTQGTVTWFNNLRGFGFIQPESVGDDIFVDISAVERAGMQSLAGGQKVSFLVVVDPRTGMPSADNLHASEGSANRLSHG